MSFGIPFFPQEASSEAGRIDALFYTLLAFSAVLGLALAGLVVGYAVKYRVGSKADRTGKRSRIYADRTPSRDCDHRDSSRDAAARPGQGQREG